MILNPCGLKFVPDVYFKHLRTHNINVASFAWACNFTAQLSRNRQWRRRGGHGGTYPALILLLPQLPPPPLFVLLVSDALSIELTIKLWCSFSFYKRGNIVKQILKTDNGVSCFFLTNKQNRRCRQCHGYLWQTC